MTPLRSDSSRRVIPCCSRMLCKLILSPSRLYYTHICVYDKGKVLKHKYDDPSDDRRANDPNQGQDSPLLQHLLSGLHLGNVLTGGQKPEFTVSRPHQLVRKKGFPFFRIGGRMIIPRDGFLAWLNEQITNQLPEKYRHNESPCMSNSVPANEPKR